MKARDGSEAAARLGCGALLGLVLGASYGFYWTDTSLGFVAYLIVFVLVCALSALRFGDRFWLGLRSLLGYWHDR
ncbi:MAG: hypothetical protein P1V81_14470 [Planctomycetota bacterium]|nr:hypothetical protein [Planctomycetota bacterium]